MLEGDEEETKKKRWGEGKGKEENRSGEQAMPSWAEMGTPCTVTEDLSGEGNLRKRREQGLSLPP